METAEIFYNPNNLSYLLNFKATPTMEYIRARRYLKHIKLKSEKDFFVRQQELLRDAIKNNMPQEWIDSIKHINPKLSIFSQSATAALLERYGIKSLKPSKQLDGILYGTPFQGNTWRDFLFITYRTTNLPLKRGCPNMCEHCFHAAVPASKTELNVMPFEDFKRITDGFLTVNKRINRILENDRAPHLIGEHDNTLVYDRAANEVGLFYDSDGMNVIARDINGKEYDYVDLAEMFYNATGKQILFDTAGWNPENKILQQRAEKYAKYFAQPELDKKFVYNLSVNTFNPLYLKAYKLGYRPGYKNDLTNPAIQKGKMLYDKYIYRMANMIATLGTTDNAYLLLTFSTKYETNMNGMYFSDLKLILQDVEKKCGEILKAKYSTSEYLQKQNKVSRLIERSLNRAEDYNHSISRCTYTGRYKELYNSRNPQAKYPREDTRITKEIPDINALPEDEFEQFLKDYMAVIDTNGQIYYQRYDTSVRPMGKQLHLSTNGKKTPPIHNLEHRKKT